MRQNTQTSAISGVSRRWLLGMALLGSVPLVRPAFAAAPRADATTAIRQLNEALLVAMKTALQSDFNHRFDVLAPVIDQVFDLRTVLAVSVGPSWASLPVDQQTRLLDAFRRYTVASYLANFDSYSGESFTISPDTRGVGAGREVVESRIVPAKGEAIQLDYVMQQTDRGWKVVDVLAAGSISRVAVQRSDFRHVLSNGGGNALVATLLRKVSDLSGGALA